MRDTDFLPGPWEVFRKNNGGQEGLYVKQPGDNGLFLVKHTFDGIQAEANVRLMASAPEMYEALKLYVEFEYQLVLDSEAWGNADGLPKFTQGLLDKWTEIRAKRNEVLNRIEEEIR